MIADIGCVAKHFKLIFGAGASQRTWTTVLQQRWREMSDSICSSCTAQERTHACPNLVCAVVADIEGAMRMLFPKLFQGALGSSFG